jgi:hypothetical protein
MTIDLFKGLKKIGSIGNLVVSPTRLVGESFFDYEYLREFDAKIEQLEGLNQRYKNNAIRIN